MAANRKIEVGIIHIHLPAHESAVAVVEGLLRPMVNKEIAAMMGISERTVMRWKKSGQLPSRGRRQVFLIELLHNITQPPARNGERRAS